MKINNREKERKEEEKKAKIKRNNKSRTPVSAISLSRPENVWEDDNDDLIP